VFGKQFSGGYGLLHMSQPTW